MIWYDLPLILLFIFIASCMYRYYTSTVSFDTILFSVIIDHDHMSAHVLHPLAHGLIAVVRLLRVGLLVILLWKKKQCCLYLCSVSLPM